jgi:hypothetical protein
LKNTPPQALKPVAMEVAVVLLQIDPQEAGSLEQIDFGHDETVFRQFFRGGLRFPFIAAKRAFLYGGRNLEAPHSGHSLVGASPTPIWSSRLTSCSIDPCNQRGRTEIEHDAIFFDDVGIFSRINGAQPATDHLNHGGFIGAGAQQHDARGRRVIPAFRQHSDVDDDLGFAIRVFR